MAHNLFNERFLGREKPAWHNLGTVFTDPISVSDAVTQSRLDYGVHLRDLFVGDDFLHIPDRKAIVRDATPDDPQQRVFGVVANNYQIIQNKDLAKILDPLTKYWPVETAGALGNGETIFLSLDAGDHMLNKDEHLKLYFLVTDTKDGTEAFRVVFTPVRVVCQNTLNWGIQKAQVDVRLSHKGDLAGDVEWVSKMIALMNGSKDATIETFNNLIATRVTPEQVKKVIEMTYPMPKVPGKVKLAQMAGDGVALGSLSTQADKAMAMWQYQIEQIEKKRSDTHTRYDRINDEFTQIANTAWAALNAVVENEDYRDGRVKERSLLFGERARTKQLAYRSMMKVV